MVGIVFLLSNTDFCSVRYQTIKLSYMEYFYKIRKEFSHADAVTLSNIFLNIPNLTFIPVDKKVITSAHALLKEYELNPRDALHAASACLAGCQYVISEDSDFNRFSFIARKWMEL